VPGRSSVAENDTFADGAVGDPLELPPLHPATDATTIAKPTRSFITLV
jgi:hypothetical protein